jgi:hypothetical protein
LSGACADGRRRIVSLSVFIRCLKIEFSEKENGAIYCRWMNDYFSFSVIVASQPSASPASRGSVKAWNRDCGFTTRRPE